MCRKTLRTTRYQITLRKEGVPSGAFRFAFFTDLHNCCGREEAERLLSALEAGKPDFVLCGGDSIVAKPGRTTAPAVAFLQEVGRRFPLYCGTGNHEYRARIYPDTYKDMYREFTEPLRKSGVTILENSAVSFLCRNIPVQILGFDLDRYYYRRFHHSILPEGELDRALGRPDSRAVTILLAHNPLMLQTYLRSELEDRFDSLRPLSRRCNAVRCAPRADQSGFPPFSRRRIRSFPEGWEILYCQLRVRGAQRSLPHSQSEGACHCRSHSQQVKYGY